MRSEPSLITKAGLSEVAHSASSIARGSPFLPPAEGHFIWLRIPSLEGKKKISQMIVD